MKGFIPKFYRDGQPDGYLYLPAVAGTYQVGQALYVNGGLVACANPSSGVKYVSMYEGTVKEGEVSPVICVDCSTEYEVVLEEPVSGLAPGAEFEVDATGMKIGVQGEHMRVISCTGANAGDTAVVQFLM